MHVVVNLSGEKRTELPPIRPDAMELWCGHNKLTSLPNLAELTPNLTSLWCQTNKLKALPDLPAGLTELVCDTNELTALPELPAGLTQLMCSGNNLKVLPNLPPSLTFLGCSYNELKELPDLPPNLTSLVCRNNQLTALPDLPPTLITLNCLENNFPPALQDILDEYRQDIPQLIISVNYYNAEHRRKKNIRQAGRTYRNVSLLSKYPNNVLGLVGYAATGHKPTGNIQKTLRNLKRNINSYGPRRQRILQKQTRRARKNRKHN
jgi:Leucine-rich repeat (LRR) protein